jgi:hypothetical protein
VFIGLQLLGDYNSDTAVELIKRDRNTWIKYFRDLGLRKMRSREGDMEEHWHEISLLRGVFASAGGPRDPRQHRFDTRLSAVDNFLTLGNLLDVELDHLRPILFGRFDRNAMRRALMRSEVFEGPDLDVEAMAADVLREVPLGLSGVLLPRWADTMSHATMMGFQKRR